LTVTGGKGTFTFTVTKAPAGVVTPVTVAATKSGTVFTLAGENWPAGDYIIQADDGCFSAAATFNLGSFTGLPTMNWESSPYIVFDPDVDNTQGSCNYLKLNSVGSCTSSNPDQYASYIGGVYEIGMAPAGTPVSSVTNWTTWGTPQFINIAPYTASNFYAANSLAIYIRVKNCPSMYRSFTANIQSPSFSQISQSDYACNDYALYLNPSTNYYGVFCYPLHVTVNKTSDGTVIYDNPNWLTKNRNDKDIRLNYGVAYTVKITDQNGRLLVNQAYKPVNPVKGIGLSQDTLSSCQGYIFRYYYWSSLPDSCTASVPAKVTISKPGGVVVQQYLTASYDYVPVSTPILEYDTIYTIKADFGDGTDTTIVRSEPLPKVSYSIRVQAATAFWCNPNWGSIYISRSTDPYYKFSGNGTNPNQPYPAGTTWTITGPAGFNTWTSTATTDGWYPPSTPYMFLPKGAYTLTVTNDCGGKSYTATVNNLGLYDYTGFGYTSKPAVPACSGIRIYPKGQMTYQGTATDTYFRLTNGPAGYDKRLISPGDSLRLTTPGVYYLGITFSTNTAECVYATDTIYYTLPQLALDANITSSYVCVGAGVGNISITGINGTAPYTYQLWDSLNTTKQPPADITTSGVAHFSYGQGGKTYTVRVSDACGNSFAQQVYVINLNTERIVQAADQICPGDSIKLNCITLGNTAYSWTGPNGYTSNLQNPVIPNAQTNRTGWYKVSVKPEYCGQVVNDSIYITVANMSDVTAIETRNPTICVRTAIPVLTQTVSGGSGIYTYQWQSSLDGTSNWTNIAGATGSGYQPPVQTLTPGVYYYRRITTDRCTILNGNAITLTVRSCYVPVNPELMNKVKK